VGSGLEFRGWGEGGMFLDINLRGRKSRGEIWDFHSSSDDLKPNGVDQIHWVLDRESFLVRAQRTQ